MMQPKGKNIVDSTSISFLRIKLLKTLVCCSSVEYLWLNNRLLGALEVKKVMSSQVIFLQNYFLIPFE
jgi:hypothetical protein